MTLSFSFYTQHSEERNSQFQSLEQVKQRPAHLMALLHHVALQFEPGPLVRACLGRVEAGIGQGFQTARPMRAG